MERQEVINKLMTQHTPFLKNWEFFSYKDEGGLENRKNFIAALDKFMDGKDEELEFSATTYVTGHVYGREGFKDGVRVNTSRIIKIQKVSLNAEFKDLIAGKCSIEEFDARTVQLFCVTTQSGSKYYLYEEDMDPYMMLALGDYHHMGRVSGRYMPR